MAALPVAPWRSPRRRGIAGCKLSLVMEGVQILKRFVGHLVHIPESDKSNWCDLVTS